MKNLFASAALFILPLTIFSCQNANDPQPIAASGGQGTNSFEAAANETNASMQVSNPTPTRPPVASKFEWQLAKTVTVPMNKGLNLSSPFAVVAESAGDISWGSDGGCYYAIKSWKVSQANLKIVDVKSVTPDYLKTLTFVKSQVSWAPAGSYSWTNYMPDGTVIAYKTATGKFQLVVVKSASPLVLDIYQEHYYTLL